MCTILKDKPHNASQMITNHLPASYVRKTIPAPVTHGVFTFVLSSDLFEAVVWPLPDALLDTTLPAYYFATLLQKVFEPLNVPVSVAISGLCNALALNNYAIDTHNKLAFIVTQAPGTIMTFSS